MDADIESMQSKELPTMPTESEISTSCTNAGMGMASAALVKNPHDYAGPIQGKMLLVAVDAHSKWIEVSVVNSVTSAITIQKLRSMFATHGLPRVVVSDNGSVFTSNEFQEFITKNGVHHIRIAPYHPASNGLAERAVQTLKEGLKKLSNGDLETGSCFNTESHLTLLLANPQFNSYWANSRIHTLINFTLIWPPMWNVSKSCKSKGM